MMKFKNVDGEFGRYELVWLLIGMWCGVFLMMILMFTVLNPVKW